MAAKKRQSSTPLIERLLEEPHGFSFFKAVHLLETLIPRKKPLGQTLNPGEEAVRFSVKPSFNFPPSDIAHMEHREEKGPVDMEVTFMGLVGPARILPNWFNELAIERVYKKDFSLTAFFNLFHHRLISLFYLAWKKHRFPENYQPGARDRLSKYLLSAMGLGTGELADKVGLPKESLIFCSGLLSRLAPSAVAIERAVEYLSGTQVEVEQLIERTIWLSPEDQTQIGVANSKLGVDTVCGSYVWDCQSTFRIILGPMGFDYFLRLLPSGDLLRPIFSLVKYMVGIEYEFETRIVLKREEVPPCVLGMDAPSPPLLGWSTWIKSPEVMHEEDPYITFHQGQLMS